MRMRRTWLPALGAVFLLAGCSSGNAGSTDPPPLSPSPPPTTNAGPSDATLIDTLGDELRTFFGQLVPSAAAPPYCQHTLPPLQVDSSAADSVDGCITDNGANYVLRVRNRTGVPETLLFGNAISRTVPPGGVADVPLIAAGRGQYVTFSGDVAAAVTSLSIDYLRGKVQSPVFAWRSCLQQVTVACLTSNLATAFDGEVLRVRNFRIPIGRILDVFDKVLTYGPLAATLSRQAAGSTTSGRLYFG